MKKVIFTVAIFSALMISCKDNQSTNTETSLETEVHHDTEVMHEDHDHDATALNNDWVREIQLNNGSKWEANMETTKGVENMSNIIKASDLKTVEDYHALANKLNDEKNYVVKECTMEGASHDNLHVFLHPLIEKIDALGKVDTVEQGAEITSNIKENLGAYYDYFE